MPGIAGLVRQYFPKKTAFDNIRDDEVNQIALKLNNRPHKCLGYQTPIEVLRKLAEIYKIDSSIEYWVTHNRIVKNVI